MLSSIYFYYMSLLKSFVKMSFFDDKNSHFQNILIKSKPKFGTNGFLIWVSWHSCVLKRSNVALLPWFQMEKNKIIKKHYDKIWHLTPFVAYVKDKGANLAICGVTWNSMVSCNNLGMFKPFDKSCFKHTLFKVFQYININDKFSWSLKYASIKLT